MANSSAASMMPSKRPDAHWGSFRGRRQLHIPDGQIRLWDWTLFQLIADHVPDLPQALDVQIVANDRDQRVELEGRVKLHLAIAERHRLGRFSSRDARRRL